MSLTEHSLPYPDDSDYIQTTSNYYQFRLKKTWDQNIDGSVVVGYMLPTVVQTMPWISQFQLDHDKRTVSIPYADGEDFESMAISEQLQKAREHDSFEILRKWREEQYLILGIRRKVRMARAGSALFGIHTIGVHMMAFCKNQLGEMKLWVARRSLAKQTFPGMLDNTVGGGMSAEEDEAECIVREAKEEASLPEAFVKEHAKPVGTISYFYIRDVRAGGPDEVGLLQPATHHMYDLDLPEHIVPKPSDGEVQEFYLLTVVETVKALKAGQFKPNSAVALIDFLIRHGHVSAKDDVDYRELVSRIHRRIYF